MDILLRASQYKVIKKGKNHFSLKKWLKNIVENFKKIFCGELLSGGTSFILKGQEEELIVDKSLVFENEQIKWIDTPNEDNNISLSISMSQNLKK